MASEFLEEVNKKSHIKRLIQEASFLICLKAGNEEIPFEIRGGNIFIHSADQNSTYDAIISGSLESINIILTGGEKLREAMKWKKVSVETTFRKLLLLESLFYLCKK